MCQIFENDTFKSMVEENINQVFRLKSIDETRNYFLEEIEVFTNLSYIECFLNLALQLLDVFQFPLSLPCLVFL